MATGVRARQLTALLEVVAIFIGGTLLSRVLARAMGLSKWLTQGDVIAAGPSPDFLRLSGIFAVSLVLRYGVMLGLAFLIGYWHRRRRIAEYGVTTAGRPLSFHVKAGIVLFAVGVLIPRLLLAINEVVPLGDGPALWALLEGSWTPAFWLFMAVGSFLLVPLVEELFFRGYMQTRLTEDFGPASAIWLTALAFTLSHTQYFQLSVLSLGFLAGGFFGAVLLGYARYRTGSLLPGIIGHAIGNTPVRGAGMWLVPVAMLGVIVAFRRPIARHARELLRLLRRPRNADMVLVGLATIVAMLALVLSLPSTLPIVALAFVGIVVVLEVFDRRAATAGADPGRSASPAADRHTARSTAE